MSALQLEVPDEVLISLKQTSATIPNEIRMAAAAKLFEIGKLSSGRAAQLAGVTRVEFLSRINHYQVSPFNQNFRELENDVRNA